MSDTDPYGDREYLEAKREKKRTPSPTLDPILAHDTTPEESKAALTPRGGTPKHPDDPVERKRVRYQLLSGKQIQVSARTVAAVELYHFRGYDGPQAADILGIDKAALHRALIAPSAMVIKKDMLARAQDRGYTRAQARMNELVEEEDGRVAFAASKLRIEERDGKAVQRAIVQGEVTVTHRKVAVVEELSATQLVRQADGSYALPEGEQVENTAPALPHKSRTGEDGGG